MIKKKNLIPLITFLIIIALIAVLVISSLEYNSISSTNKKALKLNKAVIIYSGEEHEAVLPYNCDNLKPRTPVNVLYNISNKKEQYIYVKSVYAPLKIYANNNLIYEYGSDGSYPDYMQDPATNVEIIPLSASIQDSYYSDNTVITLRFEYLSPVARSVLTIHPPVIGTEQEILSLLFREMGFSFIFSIMLLLLGILLILVSIFVSTFEKKGVIFLWLGIFAISVGAWGFGECNLTILLINNPTLLYMIAFSGLMILPLPLMSFLITVVEYKNTIPVFVMALIYGIADIIALLLQITGTIAFSKSVFVFHILIPLNLCFIALYTLLEYLRYKRNTAKRFLLPVIIIASFSILELLNYSIRITGISIFFQIGILFFIIANCIVGSIYIKDSLKLRHEKQKLQFEINTMEYRIQEEQKHNALVLEQAQEIKRQRHDLKHQLAVIKSLNDNNKNKKLAEYLDSLVTQIPLDNIDMYCENEAVNAIVTHYASIANKNNIELSIKLIVPEHLNNITDSSICIVFGNLLENAIEACNRIDTTIDKNHKFIKLSSIIQYNTLTITMDNSFNGKYNCEQGKFRSSKRNDFGIGLNSILSIAEKHGGNAVFEAEGEIFKSSVYLNM